MRPAQTAHDNFLAYTRWSARLDPGAVVVDRDDGFLAVSFCVDWPSFRHVVRTDPRLDAETFVARADRHLRSLGSYGCIDVASGADDELIGPLAARGFVAFGELPTMVCDRPPDAADGADPDVTVRMASSDADLSSFAAVAGEAFADLSVPEDALRMQLDQPALLRSDDVLVTVAVIDGRVVAGALALLVGGGTSAYVTFVSVRRADRGRGLGDVVTRAVTRAAFARGVGSVTLDATKYGESTYRRLGYREVGRLGLHLLLPAGLAER